MKKYYLRPMRHALAVLTAGLFLGGLVSANAQNSLIFPTNVYYMSKSAAAGTAAPYSLGGGVPAGALMATPVVTSTNCTISWYGMRGWSTVQGLATGSTNWVNLATVEATNYSTTTTFPNPFVSGGTFRVSQNNTYVGVSTCAGCHPDKYNLWTNALHAGVYNNPEAQTNFSLACLTIGYGQPTGFTNATQTPYLENVSCENCHGPAGWHGAGQRDLITPAVSLDPAICGSCHQGNLHPTYQEYTNFNYATISNAPMGVIKAGASHFKNVNHPDFGCSPCHDANNRMAMVKEYYDRLAGNPHPVTLFTSTDAGAFGGATCTTCHDPHGSTNVAQLRYPTFSTNWYCVPTVVDPTPVLVTNVNGSVTTNTGAGYNTIFDSFYNPKVQVCGQCHSSRGARWDGTSYGLITNNVYTTNVTYAGYVPQVTYITNVQVFTNSSYGYIYTNGGYIGVTNTTITTNSYAVPYVTNQVWTASVTSIVTNTTYSAGVYYPLIAYTNGTPQNSTNSAGDSSPHYPMQYNVLIGQLDYDYATNAGVASKTHAHTTAPDQCVTCHVPSYSVNASTNVTGHTFVRDNYGCMASCHSSYSSAALDAKVLNLKVTTSNSMARVVSLLNQWGTNVAPAILRTNYGPLSWEYPSIGKLSAAVGQFKVGPPSAWNKSGSQPSGTNDNLQLQYVPQDIRIARFSLYAIYEDQSLGVHNPTYVSSLLADAETRVLNQFTANNYLASFAATNAVQGFAPLTVQFTNYNQSAGSYSWTFGDGQTGTGANPSCTYNTPGVYSVTCTADTQPLTRSQYIRVLTKPTVSFVANTNSISAGQTVTFTNTSYNINDVFSWRWYPTTNAVRGALNYEYSPTDVQAGTFSFTYTNAGTYTVCLRASCPGNSVITTNTAYITVH